MIATDRSIKEIRDMAAANGMNSLQFDGIEKVKAGITTMEEIVRVTNIDS